MAFVAHHAIIITANRDSSSYLGRISPIEAVLVEARRLGLTVAGPVASPVNAYDTLLIAPDGSKEGWADSDRGDARRDQLVAWLRDNYYEWVEVRYGHDSGSAYITRHEWDGTDEDDAD